MEKKRILIIDDDKDYCHIMKRNFERENEYEVYTETESEEAVFTVQKYNPDVIFLDVKMPRKDGLTVLGELKANRNTVAIPVVMLTSVDDEKTKIDAASKYSEHYFQKSTEFNVIKTKVDDIIKMRKIVSPKEKREDAPQKAPPPKTQQAPETTIKQQREKYSGRILVIDDDKEICNLVVKYLNPLGFEVDSCSDPKKAMSVFASKNPDVVILDLVMPGLNGMALLNKIKEKRKKMKVIIVTGVQDVDIIKDALALGADDVIVKPFSFKQVHVAVIKQLTAAGRT